MTVLVNSLAGAFRCLTKSCPGVHAQQKPNQANEVTPNRRQHWASVVARKSLLGAPLGTRTLHFAGGSFAGNVSFCVHSDTQTVRTASPPQDLSSF
jgi:hypothetical protein